MRLIQHQNVFPRCIRSRLNMRNLHGCVLLKQIQTKEYIVGSL